MDRSIRPDRLTLLRFHELVTLTPSPWLVKGVIRESSMALLYARRASYKSFVALSLGGAVSTGEPWLGHEVPDKGLVIYVAAEGGGGMVQRARALAAQMGLQPFKFNMRFITEPFTCQAESDDMELLIERIRTAIDWVPEGYTDPDNGITYSQPEAREWPRLIVIDTLARCFYGDENKQEDMGAFVRGLDRLKVDFNCAVLIIHHTGVAENRERGSSALGSACDTIWRLDAEEAPDCGIVMTCEKMKDSGDPDPIALIHRTVQVAPRAQDTDPEELTSVIIEDASAAEDAKKRLAMQHLRAEGPMLWSAWQEVSGMPKSSFHRMVLELRKSGEITKENGLWRAI